MAIDSKIKSWIERKLDDDYQFSDDCTHLDNLINMEWDLPASLAAYSWVRKRVSTVPHDIIKQACNIFDTFNPKFEILPRGPEDMDNAEKLERWGEWQMIRANGSGETEAFREIMKHSVAYDRIRVQIEDTNDPEYPFCIYVYHPASVHCDVAGGRPVRVVVVNNVLASDVLQHWEAYNEANVSELKKLVDKDNEQRVVYADYTDKERRLVFFEATANETIPDDFVFGDETTVVLDQENKRGFIPWAVASGSSGSILESLYKSGLVENQNFLDTMADTTVIRRGFFPNLKHVSATGKELDISFDANANGVAENGPGEDTTVLVPPPLDPGIRELMDRNNAKMNSTTGVQNLSSLDAVNVQSATLNTVVQLRMTELEPYKRNAEKVLATLLKLMFQIVKATQKPLTASRPKDAKGGKAGEKITVGAEDFDPQSLVVTCMLLPNTPTDQMQKVNMYATLKKMGFHIPDAEFVERLDFGPDPAVLEEKWLKEQVENTQLQAFIAEIMQSVQLKAQAAQMQMQMQAQAAQMQAQQPQGANPMQSGQNAPSQNNPMQEGFDQAGGMMNNPAMGGNSPYESNPEATQTVMQQ